MHIPVRLAGLVALVMGACVPSSAVACSIIPPPSPPPRAPTESEADFAARSERWYRNIMERQRQEALPAMAAHEDRLWTTAESVVLARVEVVGSIRLRGSEGQRYTSPLVMLRPVRWLKGSGSVRGMRVHYLSDDSCTPGGGDAPDSDVGDLILLFYGPGPIGPRKILDTFRSDRVVTQRSQSAFELEAGPGRP